MSGEELKAELDRLRNENAALKKGASAGIRMKVSVSVLTRYEMNLPLAMHFCPMFTISL